MLADEFGEGAYVIKPSIFRDRRTLKAVIIVDRPFFGAWHRALRQHGGDGRANLLRIAALDPAPVQAAVRPGAEAAAGAAAVGAGRADGLSWRTPSPARNAELGKILLKEL